MKVYQLCKHATKSVVPSSQRRPCHRRVAAAVTADRAALDISKMQPLADRILIKPTEADQVTAGGVLMAAGASQGLDAAQVGEVLEIGNKVELKVSRGDTVLYSKYGSSDVDAADGKIVFVRADSILGVCA